MAKTTTDLFMVEGFGVFFLVLVTGTSSHRPALFCLAHALSQEPAQLEAWEEGGGVEPLHTAAVAKGTFGCNRQTWGFLGDLHGEPSVESQGPNNCPRHVISVSL